jgi:ABC-2 type transport system ATP-binding protein
MSNVIELSGVVKRFGKVTALDNLDLAVSAGEVHAFLGPNGAGKTTTLRLLLGLIHADAGSLRVLERDPWRDPTELHRRLAYVPGDVALWPNDRFVGPASGWWGLGPAGRPAGAFRTRP